jgi:DNA-directed RNA polymerase alpha subunit
VQRKRRRPKGDGPDMSTWSAADRERHELEQKLGTPLAEMRLSVRTVNTLEEHNVILARDLLRQTHESLFKMKNFGDKTLKEVREAVKALGLTPPSDWATPPKPSRANGPRNRGLGHGLPEIW